MNGTSETTTPSMPNVLTSVSNDATRRGKEAVFVLCESCYWAATFIDKSRLNTIENGCILCNESLVSSYPILDNESFTFDYSERRGVELNFGVRRNKKQITI